MAERSEREKMVAGDLYLASDPELVEARKHARAQLRRYNASTEDQAPFRFNLLKEFFGSVGARLEIEPPFRCDYGFNIHAGDGLYMNFDCVILDCAEVRIGRNVMFGPGVHVYAATHPLEAAQRIEGPELARPVTIGDNVWVGGRSVICPGVKIGDNTTIGAGSVVTRDIPANVFAAGNPCRVIRSL
ncbi:sugar O-acetyltransferase [bacterium]|nr:sugar O-acetyltransferase [bacterium]